MTREHRIRQLFMARVHTVVRDVFSLVMHQVPHVMQQRGGNQFRRTSCLARKMRRLQAMFKHRNRLAEVGSPAAACQQIERSIGGFKIGYRWHRRYLIPVCEAAPVPRAAA